MNSAGSTGKLFHVNGADRIDARQFRYSARAGVDYDDRG